MLNEEVYEGPALQVKVHFLPAVLPACPDLSSLRETKSPQPKVFTFTCTSYFSLVPLLRVLCSHDSHSSVSCLLPICLCLPLPLLTAPEGGHSYLATCHAVLCISHFFPLSPSPFLAPGSWLLAPGSLICLVMSFLSLSSFPVGVTQVRGLYNSLGTCLHVPMPYSESLGSQCPW